jgi:hypothetical protein
MKRLLVTLATLALAAPAAALPPLQPHAAPIVLGVGGAPPLLSARTDRALRAASERKGMFLLDPPSIPMAPVRACAGRANPRACLRPPLLAAPRGDPTVPIHVAVLVQPAPGGLVRVSCIGAGKAPEEAARQSLLLNLNKALSTNPADHDKPLDDLSWCVFHAMNEYLL